MDRETATRIASLERRLSKLEERFVTFRTSVKDKLDRLQEKDDIFREDIKDIQLSLKFIDGRKINNQGDTVSVTEFEEVERSS